MDDAHLVGLFVTDADARLHEFHASGVYSWATELLSFLVMSRRRQTRKFTASAVLPWLIGGSAAIVAELGRRMYRDHQMFVPSPNPVKSWDPADYGIPRHAVEEHWIETPDGERLHSWYCRAKA